MQEEERDSTIRNPATRRPYMQCDECGRRVFMPVTAGWRRSRTACKNCGCTRLVEATPNNTKE